MRESGAEGLGMDARAAVWRSVKPHFYCLCLQRSLLCVNGFSWARHKHQHPELVYSKDGTRVNLLMTPSALYSQAISCACIFYAVSIISRGTTSPLLESCRNVLEFGTAFQLPRRTHRRSASPVLGPRHQFPLGSPALIPTVPVLRNDHCTLHSTPAGTRF